MKRFNLTVYVDFCHRSDRGAELSGIAFGQFGQFVRGRFLLGWSSILACDRHFVEHVDARSQIVENLEDQVLLLLGVRVAERAGLDPVVVEGFKRHFDNLLFYCNNSFISFINQEILTKKSEFIDFLHKRDPE